MSNYFVARDRGVSTKSGQHLQPGSRIVDVAVLDNLEALIRAGFVVVADAAPADVEPEPQGRTGLVSPSPWSRNPADLEGYGLDELNVMVSEIDASVEPFDTVEEAVLWLSQDYEAAEGE